MIKKPGRAPSSLCGCVWAFFFFLWSKREREGGVASGLPSVRAPERGSNFAFSFYSSFSTQYWVKKGKSHNYRFQSHLFSTSPLLPLFWFRKRISNSVLLSLFVAFDRSRRQLATATVSIKDQKKKKNT